MLRLDANGSVISPELARRFQAQMELAFHLEFSDTSDFWFEMHTSQNTEWENCSLPVQLIEPESTAHESRRTFVGFPLELNAHLSPQVILLRKNRKIVGEIARLGLTKWNAEEVNA